MDQMRSCFQRNSNLQRPEWCSEYSFLTKWTHMTFRYRVFYWKWLIWYWQNFRFLRLLNLRMPNLNSRSSFEAWDDSSPLSQSLESERLLLTELKIWKPGFAPEQLQESILRGPAPYPVHRTEAPQPVSATFVFLPDLMFLLARLETMPKTESRFLLFWEIISY